MTQEVQRKTPEQMVDAIFALNLDSIKMKLMDKTEGHGWTCRQADQNELEYRRFLVLLAKYPGQSLAPPTEVDKFWHGHILDTMKYAEDCDNVFGCFMHHFPYFGMHGEEDAANLVSAFMNMQRLHDREFGNEHQVGAVESAWCAAIAGETPNASAHKSAWCAAISGNVRQASDKDADWCTATAAGQAKRSAVRHWC
ncbi:MAG: hypothetical protein A3I66_03750 [Burkholderiales bacterium RIFCSPLOWO2_02_FULL_57_36]|nr:MAG: hypothetical protein A3I66_03750 [Burkholderiales bacterium RIFCSPLOWO2_02_FULL_57_36]